MCKDSSHLCKSIKSSLGADQLAVRCTAQQQSKKYTTETKVEPRDKKQI